MSPSVAQRVVERSSARSARRPGRLSTALRSYGPPVLTPVVLLVLLFGGVRTPVIGIVGLVALAGTTLVAARGFEQSALVLLCGGFALAPLDRLRPVPGVPFVSASDLLLFLGFGLLVVVLVGRRVRPDGWYLGASLAVVVAGLLVCLASPVPATSLNVMLRLVVGALLLPLMLMMWAPGLNVLRLLAGSYVLGSAGNVVYGVVAGPRNFEGRILGYSEHYNVLGLCALLAVALIPILLRTSRPEHLWIWWVLGGISAYGIWASGSRAALLVAGIIGLLYPVMARSIRIALALTGAGIVGLYFVGAAVMGGDSSTNALGRLLGNGSASASDLQREINARIAVDQFQSSPYLGNGFTEGTLDAHNVYLQIAAAGGIVMVVAFTVLVVGVIRHPFRLGVSYRLLVLPALAYALIAPITSVIWDRYIWCVLALPFLVAVTGARSEGDDAAPATTAPSTSEELAT